MHPEPRLTKQEIWRTKIIANSIKRAWEGL